MPDDIYISVWKKVMECIQENRVAVTLEIYEEMTHIGGTIGTFIGRSKSQMVLDIGDNDWDWGRYADQLRRMQSDHFAFISEYNGGAKQTICLNDLSVVALANALNLPVVSMESSTGRSLKHRRIPDICRLEDAEHLAFNDFLRRERFKFE